MGQRHEEGDPVLALPDGLLALELEGRHRLIYEKERVALIKHAPVRHVQVRNPNGIPVGVSSVLFYSVCDFLFDFQAFLLNVTVFV